MYFTFCCSRTFIGHLHMQIKQILTLFSSVFQTLQRPEVDHHFLNQLRTNQQILVLIDDWFKLLLPLNTFHRLYLN